MIISDAILVTGKRGSVASYVTRDFFVPGIVGNCTPSSIRSAPVSPFRGEGNFLALRQYKLP